MNSSTDSSTNSSNLSLPPSSTSGSTVLVGLLSLAACIWLLFDLPLFDLKPQAAANTDAAVFLVLFIGLPMVMWEVLWHKSYTNPSANLAVVLQTKNKRRVFIKWLGLAATLAPWPLCIGCCLCINKIFTSPSWRQLLVCSPPYCSWRGPTSVGLTKGKPTPSKMCISKLAKA